MDDSQWLVVGLGNPGPDYAGTRHNVGQMVLAELAHRLSASFKNHRTNASVAEGRPQPGGPTQALLRYYDLDVSRLIVVHDELDIDFDVVRLKHGGGHGGHNGLRDIIAATGSPDFLRVRVGIGRPPGRQPAADYVLKSFSSTERKELPLLLGDAADAVEMIVADGLTAAQLKFHTAKA